MNDLRLRKALVALVCAVGLAGCVAETPVDGGPADQDDAGAGGAGGEGGGRYTAPDVGPDSGEDFVCESACRPTGNCGEGRFCTLRGCCEAPSAAVIEHLSIGRGAGVLMLQAEVFDQTLDAETLVVLVGDAVLSHPLQLTIAERQSVRIPLFTESLADEAVVYVRDSAGVESARITVPVVDLGIRRPTATCDATGFENWCGRGALCLAEAEAAEGECVSVDAQVWRREDGAFWLDVRAFGASDVPPAINSFTANGQLVSPWFVQDPESWRFLGLFWEAGAGVEVRYLSHLVQGAVTPSEPVARATGATCDRERIADACPAGGACLDGTCAAISAPVLGAVNAVWQDGALALRFEGSDDEGDVASYIIVFDANDRGRHDGRFGQRRTDSGVSVESGIDVAATRFVAWYSMAAPVRPTTLRVQVIDAEGLASAILEVPVTDATPQSPTGSLGWRCDPQGLISACEPSLSCTADVRDGSARCREGYGRCPDLNYVELAFIDGIAEIENETVDAGAAYDDDPLSCVQGASGRTRYYRFEAPLTGRYRASVLTEWGGPFHIAARPFCNLTQELACATATAEANAQFEVDLTAGQPLTIAFMASWSRSMGAPYTLRVEVLP